MLKNITPNIITSTLSDFVGLEKALQQMPFVTEDQLHAVHMERRRLQWELQP